MPLARYAAHTHTRDGGGGHAPVHLSRNVLRATAVTGQSNINYFQRRLIRKWATPIGPGTEISAFISFPTAVTFYSARGHPAICLRESLVRFGAGDFFPAGCGRLQLRRLLLFSPRGAPTGEERRTRAPAHKKRVSVCVLGM